MAVAGQEVGEVRVSGDYEKGTYISQMPSEVFNNKNIYYLT